jgi:hypothetical protein
MVKDAINLWLRNQYIKTALTSQLKKIHNSIISLVIIIFLRHYTFIRKYVQFPKEKSDHWIKSELKRVQVFQ